MSDTGVSYYLKIDGAEGESQHTAHKNEITVLSWSFGGDSESTVGRTQGSGAGKVTMRPICVVAELDASYTKLAGFLTKGKHISSAQLAAVKNGADNEDYLVKTLSEVFISALNVTASTQVPVVNIELTYKSIKTQYKKQTTTGTLETSGTHSFDASTNITT
jgi:type VI secretion system secreted protein Hcp